MPRPYQRRHVDADFDGHAPHRRDLSDTPAITITEETQRNIVALAENQRALSTIAASVGSLSMTGYAPNRNEHPELAKINDQRPPLGVQMGVPGIPIFDGVINDPAEYNKDFYWRDGVAKYDEMYRSDAQVRQSVAVMSRPIRRAKWDIEPVSEAKIDQEIASAVKSALFDDMCYYTDDGEEIIQTWDDILKHLLLMFVYGFSTMEYVWRKDKDGWTKWACWAPILPRTVWRWWTGGQGELLGIQQYAFKDGLFQLIEIPAKKILRVAYDQQGNNYDGLSPLRSSYPHWFYKTQFEAIQAVGIERVGLPMPVFSLPAASSSPDDFAKARAMGQNIRANEKMVIVKPAEWGLEYLQGTANVDQINTAIEFHDRMIARNVGAMFLNLGGQRGAMNLDKSQTQTFMQAIQAEADYLAERISASAIRKFIKANYDGVKVYPKLVCSKISTQDIETLGTAIAGMAGFINPDPTLEDWLRDEMGLPKAAPQQDPYTINSDSPMGGEGDNGPAGPGGSSDGSDNAGDNSGDKSADNSGDNSNKAGGKDNSEEGANDSGSSGSGYTEPAASSWLLDETMDAVERGVMHMSDNDQSVKLGFSFGRPRGGLGGLGGHFADGGEVLRDRLGHWEGRTAGTHGHHEAVEERGGGMRGRPPVTIGRAVREAIAERSAQFHRDVGQAPNERTLRRWRVEEQNRITENARARRAERDASRGPAKDAAKREALDARVAAAAHQRGIAPAIPNAPRAALLHRIAEVSPVASGRSTSDITWRGADGNILHPAGNGMRTLNGDHVSEQMRSSAARIEQEMRNSTASRIVGVSQTGQVHELGAHPRDLRGVDARTLAQLQGGVVIVNHPLGSAPKLSEMAAAAHVGAVQLRVVTPFYRHAISSANARQAINLEATRHLAPLYRHTTSVVTAQVKDAIALKQVSPWHAARQIGHVVWQRVSAPAKLHYVRAAWDEESALMREQDEESVKLFGFGGFHIEEPGGARGGLGGLGHGTDRAIYSKGHRFDGSRKGEHTQEHLAARHHGDEEHGGGQGHGGNRGKHEKSATERTAERANKGAARRSAGKAKGEGAAKAAKESPERVSERVGKAYGKMQPARNKDEELTRFNQLRQHENDLTSAKNRAPADSAIRHTLTQQLGHIRFQREQSGQNLIHKKQEQYDNEQRSRDFAANRERQITRAARRLVKAQKAVDDSLARGVEAHSAEDKANARELMRAAEAYHGLHPAHQNPEHYLTKAPTAKSAAPKAKAPAPKAPRQSAAERNAAEIAALHETSAKWQAEPGHTKELPPTDISKIVPVKTNLPGIQINIAAPLNIPVIHEAYGSDQIGAVLHLFTSGRLKEALDAHGPDVPRTGGHDALVSRITAKLTHGHYSANFPHEAKASAKAPATAKATKPIEQMTHEELLAHAKQLEAGKGAGARAASKTSAKSSRATGYEAWKAQRETLRHSFGGHGDSYDQGILAQIAGLEGTRPGYAARYARERRGE